MPTLPPEQHPAVVEVRTRRATAFNRMRVAEARLNACNKTRDQLGVLESQRAILEAEEAIEGLDLELKSAWDSAVADKRAAAWPKVAEHLRRFLENQVEGAGLAAELLTAFEANAQNGVPGGNLFAGPMRETGARRLWLKAAAVETDIDRVCQAALGDGCQLDVNDLRARLRTAR